MNFSFKSSKLFNNTKEVTSKGEASSHTWSTFKKVREPYF
jgi:hypothetical protein